MLNGIIVSLAVVGIVWLLKLLFTYGKLLVDHLFYSSVKIEGDWKTELGNDSYTESVKLKWFGYRVWGDITCVSSPERQDNGKVYKFSGSWDIWGHHTQFKTEISKVSPECNKWGKSERVEGSDHFPLWATFRGTPQQANAKGRPEGRP